MCLWVAAMEDMNMEGAVRAANGLTRRTRPDQGETSQEQPLVLNRLFPGFFE
jgi:hypothetical protein